MRMACSLLLYGVMITTQTLDALTTEQILKVYERVFAPLDRKTRARIVATARGNGWDRAWDTAWSEAA